MKKIAILLATGYEEGEALVTADVLRRAGLDAQLISMTDDLLVTSSHHMTIRADRFFGEDIASYDMVVLPGGLPGADHLKADERVLSLLRTMNENKKWIAAICAAPIVLAAAGIVKGKKVTSYPGEVFENQLAQAEYSEEIVVEDENLITARGPAITLAFAYRLVEKLGIDSEPLRQGMLYTMLAESIRGH